MANILSYLRRKKYVSMELDEKDRRRMNVLLTETGQEYIQKRYSHLEDYFDLYISVIGEKDITQLLQILRKTLVCSQKLGNRSFKKMDK